jgi:hypothetical protein
MTTDIWIKQILNNKQKSLCHFSALCIAGKWLIISIISIENYCRQASQFTWACKMDLNLWHDLEPRLKNFRYVTIRKEIRNFCQDAWLLAAAKFSEQCAFCMQVHSTCKYYDARLIMLPSSRGTTQNGMTAWHILSTSWQFVTLLTC